MLHGGWIPIAEDRFQQDPMRASGAFCVRDPRTPIMQELKDLMRRRVTVPTSSSVSSPNTLSESRHSVPARSVMPMHTCVARTHCTCVFFMHASFAHVSFTHVLVHAALGWISMMTPAMTSASTSMTSCPAPRLQVIHHAC